MDMPELSKCCFCFPLRPGTLFIGVSGLVLGLSGLIIIIIYGVTEKSFLTHFFDNENWNPDLKNMVLLTFGLSSLVLTAGSAFMILGSVLAIAGAVRGGYMIHFVMAVGIMIVFVAVPMLCFFFKEACAFQHTNTAFLVFVYLMVAVYLMIWFYFISVAWNYAESL